jgi:hypothetical protein
VNAATRFAVGVLILTSMLAFLLGLGLGEQAAPLSGPGNPLQPSVAPR